MVGALLTGSHSQARLDKALSESSAMVGIDVASLHVDVAAIGAELPASLARTSKTDRIDAATLAGVAGLLARRPDAELHDVEAEMAGVSTIASIRSSVIRRSWARPPRTRGSIRSATRRSSPAG
jgi:transposase